MSLVSRRIFILSHAFPAPTLALAAGRTMASAATSSSHATSAAALATRLQSAVHVHARGKHPAYPARQPVSDEQVPWSAPFPAYKPPEFTSDNVKKKSARTSHPSRMEVLEVDFLLIRGADVVVFYAAPPIPMTLAPFPTFPPAPRTSCLPFPSTKRIAL
jgi:hypothetical protein